MHAEARIEAGMCRWLSTASKSNICLDPVSTNLNTITKRPSVSLTCCRTISKWIQLILFLLCLRYTTPPQSTSALIFESKPIHFGSSQEKFGLVTPFLNFCQVAGHQQKQPAFKIAIQDMLKDKNEIKYIGVWAVYSHLAPSQAHLVEHQTLTRLLVCSPPLCNIHGLNFKAQLKSGECPALWRWVPPLQFFSVAVREAPSYVTSNVLIFRQTAEWGAQARVCGTLSECT